MSLVNVSKYKLKKTSLLLTEFIHTLLYAPLLQRTSEPRSIQRRFLRRQWRSEPFLHFIPSYCFLFPSFVELLCKIFLFSPLCCSLLFLTSTYSFSFLFLDFHTFLLHSKLRWCANRQDQGRIVHLRMFCQLCIWLGRVPNGT